MNAQVFHKEYEDYIGQREQAFYWKEVSKTVIWHDISSNEICSDIGIRIRCDEYDSVHDLINDLYDAIVSHYSNKGVEVHEAPVNINQ